MSIPSSLTPLFNSGSSGGLQIERSLRFNSSDSGYLSRGVSTTSTRKIFTFSVWCKRSKFSTNIYQTLYCGGAAFGDFFGFNSTTDVIRIFANGASDADVSTTAVFRDPSAWYHIVIAVDTTQTTPANRIRVYVNNIEQSLTGTYPTQDYVFGKIFNISYTQYINRVDGPGYGDFYLANYHCVDGQQLTPSSFTETDATTGQLIPKTYTGSYGTNGFNLLFADNSSNTASTLGKDYSGLGNNWTPNNLSVGFSVTQNYSTTTSGTPPSPFNSAPYLQAFDGDLSTAFFWYAGTWAMTWTSLPSAVTVSSTLRVYSYPRLGTITVNINGSNVASITGNTVDWRTISFTGTINTISFTGTDVYSGVYAIEVDGAILIDPRANSVNDSLVDSPTNYGTDTYVGGEVRGNYATFNPLNKHSASDALSNGNLDLVAANSSAGLTPSTIGVSSGKWYCEFVFTGGTAGDLLAGIRRTDSRNYDNSYLYRGNSNLVTNGSVGSNYGAGFSLNDVVGVAFDADNGKLFISVNGTFTGSGNPVTGANPAFSSITGTYNLIVGTYGNLCNSTFNAGQRAFAYTAPSGFKGLCTQNLPATLVTKSNTVFDVVTYNGSASPIAITLPGGFSPDLVWLKCRSNTNYQWLTDTIRGTNKQLTSNDTIAEESRTDRISSFDASGFTVANHDVNSSGQTFVGWAWDAGTSTVSNTQGSITGGAQVRANPTAGFSVVAFNSGSGAPTAYTVGHGLNVAPQFIIAKSRTSAAYNWSVYHTSIATTTNKYLSINTTSATLDNGTSIWGAAQPTSTLFGITSGNAVVANTDCIAYCFAPVDGYSAMGSYVASSGLPYVYLGFRPRFVLIKNITSSSTGWRIIDSARDSFNDGAGAYWLSAQSSGAEVDERPVDLLSNGFKLRMTDGGDLNYSSDTYIYLAFAESPFNYSRAR